MLVTQIETVLKLEVDQEEVITIMALQWEDQTVVAMIIDHQGLVEIISTSLHQVVLEIQTLVIITILALEVITVLPSTTLLPHHTTLHLLILQTTIEEVTLVDSMEVLLLTTEGVMLIIPPHLIELETTMTERETESTWIREMIRMEEAMTTTIHQLEAAVTNPERVAAATTMT